MWRGRAGKASEAALADLRGAVEAYRTSSRTRNLSELAALNARRGRIVRAVEAAGSTRR